MDKNATIKTPFPASLLFLCLLCFKDSKAADVKEKGGTLTAVTRWSGRRSAGGCQCDPDKERSSSALLCPALPCSLLWERHAKSGNASKSHEAHPTQLLVLPSPLQRAQHHPDVPWSSSQVLQTAVSHRAWPGNPSLLRAPEPAAGRADRPSPLTQRASAHTCPKQQGHAAEPRCGSCGVQRNGCAEEGWAGLNLRHQSAGSKGQCSLLSMTQGFNTSQYGNHPSLRIFLLFLFFLSPYPSIVKVTNKNLKKNPFPSIAIKLSGLLHSSENRY